MTLKNVSWAVCVFVAWTLPMLYKLTTDDEGIFPLQLLQEKPDEFWVGVTMCGLLTLFTLAYQSAFIERWNIRHPILQWLLLIPAYGILLIIILVFFGIAIILLTMPWWGWVIGLAQLVLTVLVLFWRILAPARPRFHGCF